MEKPILKCENLNKKLGKKQILTKGCTYTALKEIEKSLNTNGIEWV